MRRKQRPTQDLVDEALAEKQSFDVEPKQEEPSEPNKMGNLEFIGRVVAEIAEHLP